MQVLILVYDICRYDASDNQKVKAELIKDLRTKHENVPESILRS